jgi:DNA primase
MSGVRTAGTDPVIESVRSASDIIEIVGQYVSLKKVGRTWKGLCPFHQEKTPSFIVSPERQTFHCFGCGQGGDVFRFVQEAEKVGFGDALRTLAERAGIKLPARRANDESAGALVEACEAAATLYERFLDDSAAGKAARDFLARRGIEEEVRRRFGVGYAPAGWDTLTSRLRGRFGEEVLVRAGLAAARDSGGVYDRFRDRVVVPLRQPNGRTIGFGGRSLGDEEPKYLNSPETQLYRKGRFVFALGEAREGMRRRGEAVLVEGYFDVLALHQAGVDEAIASSGTAVTEEQGALILRSAERLCLMLDGDSAGQAAARKALGPLLASGLEVRVATLPSGDDPDSFVRREGKDGVEQLRAEAVDPVTFLCQDATDEGKRRAAREAVVALAREVKDPGRREAILERADQLLVLRESGLKALRRAVEGEPRPVRVARPEVGPGGRQGAAPRPTPRTAPSYAEKSLIALLVAWPDLAPEALRGIEAGWIEHPWTRAVWQAIAEDPEGNAARWAEALDEDAADWVLALSVRDEEMAEPERALVDLQRTFRIRSVERALREAQQRVAASRDDEEQKHWLQQVQEHRSLWKRLQSEFGESGKSIVKGAGE